LRNKVGILIESDFYEPEIDYYSRCFKLAGLEVHFLTRLWGNAELTFKGHEERRLLKVNESFENVNLKEYAAIIIPAGYVADRLRYTEDINKLPPACEFLKKAFADKKIIKGIICHGAWLMAPISNLVKGRKMVVHNNLRSDAKLMGINYVDEDVVVDGDLVSARTGAEHVAFAQKIIGLIQFIDVFNSLNSKIDILESKVKRLEQMDYNAAKHLYNSISTGGNKMAKVLIIATNYGSWAEELQAPWDACKKAGFEVTLATPKGKKPLPFKISIDPDFVDPIQNVKTNPPEVCDRCKELVDGDEWANPKKFTEVNMDDYDAIVLTGGPGANLDMANCWELHQLIMRAYKTGKIVAALCYAVSTLVFCRDPENDYKSIIYGKKITAHPRAWDFYGPGMAMAYEVYGETEDNRGTDVVTPGFPWPIEDLVRDAVGPNGACIARINANRESPQVYYDHPFITGTSVESSIAYGDKIVEVLKKLGK
jgi:putative intracellular protease/amidase